VALGNYQKIIAVVGQHQIGGVAQWLDERAPGGGQDRVKGRAADLFQAKPGQRHGIGWNTEGGFVLLRNAVRTARGGQ